VAEAGDSILAFEEFLDTGDRGLLEAIERYNEDDCRSTWLLHRWLLGRRAEAIERFGREIPWRVPPEAKEPDPESRAEVDELRAALTEGVAEDRDGRDDADQARWLLAQLLDYHRREDKPAWWAYFDRLEADEEALVEQDTEAIGGLEVDRDADPRPLPKPAKSLIHTLRFPPQDHKVGPGDYVDPATQKAVHVERVDDGNGVVEIRRGTARRNDPLPRALIPGTPYDTREQRAALRRLASDAVGRGLGASGRYAALRAILRGDLPRTAGQPAPGDLQDDGFDLEEAKRIAAGLDGRFRARPAPARPTTARNSSATYSRAAPGSESPRAAMRRSTICSRRSSASPARIRRGGGSRSTAARPRATTAPRAMSH
jgi:RNase_H superfamily